MEIERLLELTEENNKMLTRIVDYIDKISSEEYINKQQFLEFMNNVVADFLSAMLIKQGEGQKPVTKQDIMDIIKQMKV